MSVSRPLSRRRFNALVTSIAGQTFLAAHGIPRDRYPNAAQASFVHPGMLQSSRDLERMRGGIQNHKQPLFYGFEKLRADPHSQLDYQPRGASPEIGRNPNVRFDAFDSDSNAAYQCALMGHLTGEPGYFSLCRRILEDWTATLKRITGADAILCAALGGFKMANAAELLLYSSAHWPHEQAEQFGRMLQDVLVPVIVGFAPFANGNWDTAALKTMMAIAIYTDDRALFNRALVYYLHGCGNGSIGHYIYTNGQCQESGRDQQHTQLGLAHLGDCCEMAWHQGLDLYGALGNRLLLGFEYTARYILGEEVPFVPDEDRTGKYKHSVIAPRSALRPNYELIYNHYAKRRGIPTPWTQKAAEAVRPEGPGFQADATGFGTLLYTRDSGPDFIDSPAAGIGGLHATQGTKSLDLSWVSLAAATPYSITRTGLAPADSLSTTSRINSFRDTTVVPGHIYGYRIRSNEGHGRSSTIQATAELPPGWSSSSLDQQLNGSAFFDGKSWRLSAKGSPPPYTAGGGFFVHKGTRSNVAVTARLSAQFASQALHAGIALLDESSVGALLLLEPGDGSATEHVPWTVRLYTREKTTSFKIAGEQLLQEPAVLYGRVQLPLRLRLESSDGHLMAAISLESETWKEVGQSSISRSPMLGGMLLDSGLVNISTEVIFDEVEVG